jgi:hypothetical protein
VVERESADERACQASEDWIYFIMFRIPGDA